MTDKLSPLPTSEATVRVAFAKLYPKLDAEVALGENNPDYRGLADINGRHALNHFSAGWRAALSAEREPAYLSDGRVAYPVTTVASWPAHNREKMVIPLYTAPLTSIEQDARRFADLMGFKAEQDRASERAMEELAKQAQELHLGYE